MEKTVKFFKKPITATLIAIFCGFLVATVILAVSGYNPFEAFGALLGGIFGRPKYVSNVIIKSTPIILTGVSVAFAYKMGLFNIGAEGQFIVGAVAANVVGIVCDFPAVIEVPLVLLAGVAAGALYGGIAGWLKAKYNINEVIVGIMLNWMALYFSNFVCNVERFHKPESDGAYAIHESGFISFFTNWKTTEAAAEFVQAHPFVGDILRTDANAGILIAIALTFAVSFLLYKTTKGYELRAVGSNRDAAEFAGIDVGKNMVQTMLIAGALSGIAAAIAIAGNNPHGITQLSAFESNGLNGLSVAFIAGGSPIGCIFAGLLFGALLYGGQSIQYVVGAPSEIISILIGTIVFLIALKDMVPVLIDKMGKRGVK